MNNINIDENFPKRVLITSLILAGLFIMISISMWSFEVTTGFVLGVGISLVFFMILCYGVKCFFDPNKKGGKLFFGVLSLFKFFGLTLILFLIFKYLSFNYFAFLIGIGLVQLVILLKVLGIVMVQYMNPVKEY